MQKIVFILKIVVIVAYCCSCSPKAITGEITDVSGRVVECKGNRFLLLKSAPMPSQGQTATFTPVRNKKDRRINCKLIK